MQARQITFYTESEPLFLSLSLLYLLSPLSLLSLFLSFNMEFEKHEKGSLLDKNLEERLKVSSGDSEAKPLIFSFVPTVGRLPAHIQLADTSKYLVRIPEEPGDKSPETVNRSTSVDVTFNSGNEQERVQGTLNCLSQVCENNSQGRGFKANDLQGMQQGDLFKAEYVFIVDSEGEDEVTSRKVEQGAPGGTGNTVARPKSLAISSSLVSDVVRPKVRGPDRKATSHPEAAQEMASQQRHGQQYKTKSSYKVFAAIPTNTLLLEQKALDEPSPAERVSRDSSVDLPLELCFPAQLRRQTEEVCATIDKVLQDSLSMHSSDSPSRSPLQTLLGSETIKTPPSLPRAAGRETKYANLSSASSTVSESQLTKPGVIRPAPIKSRILLRKEEEVCEPNPFSKYLDDDGGLFSEQDVTVPPKPVSLHPLYQTKLYPPAKSLLRPQTISHTACLSPGPFGHLSSSLQDEQTSHTLLSHVAYNKQ
ncbi:PREDICTED: muscular LMNA-interacting protein isoform X3 [Chinchilla lanigera]|uniref:muscular LMNA-interacting protein isoform X3 n=1 Tax=Chinchilla lanigera TaxID=34839 RepID=UPI00038ED155|nr:PREDICTED: muscular LMNA-interacting protein isoform X3 [Chinchilla lanigera]